MKNITLLLFFAFLSAYAIGISIGGVRQVRESSQEMFEYLSGAVSQYTPSSAGSIKSVASDNGWLLLILATAGLFKFGGIAVFGILLMKGYAAGFSITAVLRLYGINGLLLCGANILSVTLLIPAISYFGAAVCGERLKDGISKIFLKKYFFLLIFMTAIFCIDSVARGFLSSTFMKLSGFFTKSA